MPTRLCHIHPFLHSPIQLSYRTKKPTFILHTYLSVLPSFHSFALVPIQPCHRSKFFPTVWSFTFYAAIQPFCLPSNDSPVLSPSIRRLIINPLKPKLYEIIFKNSVRTLKKMYFTITKINLLVLFKGIIHLYTENHKKSINIKFSVTDC
jgi:hypothetical protein